MQLPGNHGVVLGFILTKTLREGAKHPSRITRGVNTPCMCMCSRGPFTPRRTGQVMRLENVGRVLVPMTKKIIKTDSVLDAK